MKCQNSEGKSQPSKVSWVDLYLPEKVRPYAYLSRFDDLIGAWLLVWPCFWATALASSPGKLPDIGLLAIFGCAAIPLMGYGCTINDLFDREFDSKVKRTKKRPLASGTLTPLQGICHLGLQFSFSLLILYPLNRFSHVLGSFDYLLVSVYPLMKRITHWPQAFLGLSINWGVFVGWGAVKGSLDDLFVILPLYFASFFWTLVYDTVYAHQDRKDDIKAGIKSTAVMFGDSTRKWITGFGIAFIGGLAVSGYNANIGCVYYAFLLAASCQLGWQILTVDLSNPKDCGTKFLSNKWLGAIIFSGIIFGKLLQ